MEKLSRLSEGEFMAVQLSGRGVADSNIALVKLKCPISRATDDMFGVGCRELEGAGEITMLTVLRQCFKQIKVAEIILWKEEGVLILSINHHHNHHRDPNPHISERARGDHYVDNADAVFQTYQGSRDNTVERGKCLDSVPNPFPTASPIHHSNPPTIPGRGRADQCDDNVDAVFQTDQSSRDNSRKGTES